MVRPREAGYGFQGLGSFRQLTELQKGPVVAPREVAPDGAVGLFPPLRNEEVGARNVRVVEEPQTPHFDSPHSYGCQDQRSDRHRLSVRLQHKNPKGASDAETLPPCPYPGVLQKRMVESCSFRHFVPDRLEIEKSLDRKSTRLNSSHLGIS